MEAKADRMLDEANARAELDSQDRKEESLEDLEAKYSSEGRSDIDDELEAMKKNLGLS